MRAGRRLFVATTAFMLTSTAVMAKPPAGQAGGGAAKTHAAPVSTAAKSHGPTTPKTHGPTAKTTTGATTKTKTTSPGQAKHAPTSTTSSTSTASTTGSSSGSSTTSTSDTSTTTTTTTTTWTPNNPISQKLATKANLMNRVKTTLPAGTDLNAATAGFKNFGQFIAATNVSHNLGIDFGKLKAAMTGTTLAGTTTGQPTASLGQAIQQLKPGVNADAEAARATSQANAQIAEGGGQ